jgi:hypothetical protein
MTRCSPLQIFAEKLKRRSAATGIEIHKEGEMRFCMTKALPNLIKVSHLHSRKLRRKATALSQGQQSKSVLNLKGA